MQLISQILLNFADFVHLRHVEYVVRASSDVFQFNVIYWLCVAVYAGYAFKWTRSVLGETSSKALTNNNYRSAKRAGSKSVRNRHRIGSNVVSERANTHNTVLSQLRKCHREEFPAPIRSSKHSSSHLPSPKRMIDLPADARWPGPRRMSRALINALQ